jgi:hypothetical protein
MATPWNWSSGNDAPVGKLRNKEKENKKEEKGKGDSRARLIRLGSGNQGGNGRVSTDDGHSSIGLAAFLNFVLF